MKAISNVSMYKKQLPKFLIPFASRQGKILFNEALNEGNMENFFELSEQYVTQSRPIDCAVSSLVMVLNSLGIDPGKQWKGPWRWFSEELLNCVGDAEKGISLHQFLQISLCNKTWGMGFYTKSAMMPPSETLICGQHTEKILYRSASLDTFRNAVIAGSRQSKFYVVVNNSRKALGQSGEGHYSPVAGYHSASDMCLILDVARFKYPAYWCSVKLLYEAIEREDPVSLKSRGFVCVSRSKKHFSQICSRHLDVISLKKIGRPVDLELIRTGHPDLLPVVFRMFYDLYEGIGNENDILEEIQMYPDFAVDPKLEMLVNELNPGIKNTSKLLIGSFMKNPGEISKYFRERLGILK